MGGRSYTPSPPRGYGRRGRSPSPRGRSYGGGGGGSRGRERDLPTSLLVRNLRHDCRPEDLRRPFGQFGPLKDVYLPRDYFSGEPRGFGFVQFVDPNDATEAKYQMDGQTFQGRQLTVVFAEENRKKPSDMRVRERRGGSGRFNDRRRSPPPRYSRSPPPRYAKSRSHSRDISPPPKRRHHSRSGSPIPPRENRYSRERSFSRSPVRERSPPPYDGRRGRSQSPVREKERERERSAAAYNGSRSRSRSPIREGSPLGNRSPSRSRSRSPIPREYTREEPVRGGDSPSQ